MDFTIILKQFKDPRIKNVKQYCQKILNLLVKLFGILICQVILGKSFFLLSTSLLFNYLILGNH